MKTISNRRHGKVARLPRAVREHVNLQLDEGKSYRVIIEWLTADGHAGFNKENIRQWKNGGFQDWLKHQDQLAEHESLRELAVDVAQQNQGSKTQEAVIQIGAALIFKTLIDFDPQKLSERLNARPEQFNTMLNAFTRLNRRSNELDMLKEYLRQEEERRQKELERKQNTGEPKGLSDEAGDAMERRLNLA